MKVFIILYEHFDNINGLTSMVMGQAITKEKAVSKFREILENEYYLNGESYEEFQKTFLHQASKDIFEYEDSDDNETTKYSVIEVDFENIKASVAH